MNLWSKFKSLVSLASENRALRSEVEQLEAELAMAQERLSVAQDDILDLREKLHPRSPGSRPSDGPTTDQKRFEHAAWAPKSLETFTQLRVEFKKGDRVRVYHDDNRTTWDVGTIEYVHPNGALDVRIGLSLVGLSGRHSNVAKQI